MDPNDVTLEDDTILPDTEDLDSAEQQDEGEMPKGYAKHVTKTNQAIADQSRLSSMLLRGKTPKQIADEDPKLVERLSKRPEYEDAFSFEEEEDDYDDTPDIETKVQEVIKKQKGSEELSIALGQLTYKGKKLGQLDRKKLRDNSKFSALVDTLKAQGEDTFTSVETAFSVLYPETNSKVSGSVLSPSSEPEHAEEDKLTPKEREFVAKFRKNVGLE